MNDAATQRENKSLRGDCPLGPMTKGQEEALARLRDRYSTTEPDTKPDEGEEDQE